MTVRRRLAQLCAIVVSCSIVSSSNAAERDKFVRIGSFNIANFGSSENMAYERSLIDLVNIIRRMDADLIALQEVEPGEFGRKQVERLVKLLNVAADFYETKPYEFAVSEKHKGDEVLAFLWRAPVTLESELTLIEHEEDADGDGLRAFQRVPVYALFKAGNFDFYVMNCHLYTQISGTSSEGRTVEYDAIVEWLRMLAGEAEKDAIVVGDFNRFLEGSRYPVKSAWGNLMIDNHATLFRFPLLEAIKRDVPAFDPKTGSAPEDKYSTTTSKRLSIYDQILISKGAEHEYTDTPEFGKDVGIVVFDDDKDYEWFDDTWTRVNRLLSDHRPIWIQLRLDKNDDD